MTGVSAYSACLKGIKREREGAEQEGERKRKVCVIKAGMSRETLKGKLGTLVIGNVHWQRNGCGTWWE